MAETMQGHRKWGYQTLHWWRENMSFWSAHMRPNEKTSLHSHECVTLVTCLYGSIVVHAIGVGRRVLLAGDSLHIGARCRHMIENPYHGQCGFSECYYGIHENNEPVTERYEVTQ